MEKQEIIFDAIKREMDSFIRYAFLSLVAVVTFFLYIVERQNQADGIWNPESLPNVSVLGLEFAHSQIAYALLLIPVLQLLLLRPLQGIVELITHEESKLDACKLLLSTNPSVFNPFYMANTKFGIGICWFSWFLCSLVIVFFPAITVMIWFTEVFDGDFVLSTIVFASVCLLLLGIQAHALFEVWVLLHSRRQAIFRIAFFGMIFIVAGLGVYVAAA